jgi:hypothetical protein
MRNTMAFSPEQSAIKVPAGSALEQAIASAKSVQEIQSLLWAAARAQNLIEPDFLDPEGRNHFAFHTVAQPAPKGYARTITLNGKKIILEADSEEGLVQKELEFFRGTFAAPATGTQALDANGRFTAQATQEEIEAEALRVAALDPAAVALAPTVKAALEAQGISVDDLKAYTASKRGEQTQQSWERAAEEFRNSPEGMDWPGGENMRVAADLIQANPELMQNPSAETLALVWNHMKEHNLVVENPELTALDNIGKAQTYDELKAAVGYRDPDPRSSSMWGR